MDNNLRTYQRVQVSGLNQKELIVMLYSGALKFIDEGKFGVMSALKGTEIEPVPLKEAVKKLKTINKKWLELMDILF